MAAAAAAALVTLVVVADAQAGPRRDSASRGTGTTASTRTLTFYAVPGGGSAVDTPPTGESPGDEFFEHGRLTNAGGHRRGSFTLAEQLVEHSRTIDRGATAITAYLPRGTLDLSGGHPEHDTYRLPVVGGTGEFRGARGAATLSSASHDREKILITLAR